MPAVIAPADIREQPAAFEIHEAHQHSAKMRNVGDPAACGGHGRQKLNRTEDNDKPLRLDRNDHVQIDDSIRKQNTIRKQQSVYRTRRADRHG